MEQLTVEKKRKTANTKKHIQISLSETEHSALNKIADHFDVTLTKLLREGIELWITTKKIQYQQGQASQN